jgi:hypothetical protein
MLHKYKIEIEDEDLQKIRNAVKEILRVLARKGITNFHVLSGKTCEELNK